ncbi:MAG: Tricarboxylate transport protein TctC, partial [uncultured Acetobacteraceae bacterium]
GTDRCPDWAARSGPRRRGRRAGGARPGPGQVPGAADPPRHPLAARRLGRRATPLARRTRRPQARPEHRGGEPPRRVRHHGRRATHDPDPAGRLHHQPDAPVDHPAALHRAQPALGPRGGLLPHHRPDRLVVRGRREGGRPDQVLGRLPGLRPREPRAPHLRHQRHRHHQPPDHGGAFGAREDRAGPRALPLLQRGRGGRRVRRGDERGRQLRLGTARGRRSAPAALRLDGRALPALPDRADAEGAGLRDGRHLALRPVGAEGHGPRRGEGPARRAQGRAVRPGQRRGAGAIRHAARILRHGGLPRLRAAPGGVRARHGAAPQPPHRL